MGEGGKVSPAYSSSGLWDSYPSVVLACPINVWTKDFTEDRMDFQKRIDREDGWILKMRFVDFSMLAQPSLSPRIECYVHTIDYVMIIQLTWHQLACM